MLGVSIDLINDAIRDHRLRSIKLGRRRIVPADAFEEFLRSASLHVSPRRVLIQNSPSGVHGLKMALGGPESHGDGFWPPVHG